MNYRFDYRDSFWQDYFSALDYIANVLENRNAAHELDTEFERVKRSLRIFPRASRPYLSPPFVDSDYYALPVKNYLAFYVVLGDVVEFRRFLYSRADLRNRLK